MFTITQSVILSFSSWDQSTLLPLLVKLHQWQIQAQQWLHPHLLLQCHLVNQPLLLLSNMLNMMTVKLDNANYIVWNPDLDRKSVV